jgi:hypothetical protein
MIARILLAVVVLVVGVRSVQIHEFAQYLNNDGITIEDGGPTTPYPSTIEVDAPYEPKTIKVTLYNVTHSMRYTRVILVSPTGLKMALASDNLAFLTEGIVTFTFDQGAGLFDNPYQNALQNKSYHPVMQYFESLPSPGDYLFVILLLILQYQLLQLHTRTLSMKQGNCV